MVCLILLNKIFFLLNFFVILRMLIFLIIECMIKNLFGFWKFWEKINVEYFDIWFV